MSNHQAQPSNQGKPFFETLPGLLTALATLVTAIGGCIGVILASPIIKDALFPPTPTAIVTRTSVVPTTVAISTSVVPPTVTLLPPTVYVPPTSIPTILPPNTVRPTIPPPTATPKPACAVVDNFSSMPSWTSTWEAGWGSGSANYSIASNSLRATRSTPGSSSRVIQYPVVPNTTYIIQIQMNGASGKGYWTETGFKVGVTSAQDFDANVGAWTGINKFDSEQNPNGNGGIWSTYSSDVYTGNNTTLSLGFKAGLNLGSGNNYPGGNWRNLSICPK